MAYINAIFNSYQAREPAGDDAWDRGDSEGSLEGVRVVADKFGADYNSIEFDPNKRCVVVVVLRTGDTFGSSWEAKPMESFETDEEAQAFVDTIRATVGKNIYTFEYEDKEYDAPWTGYFESLISAQIFYI